mgnify:CR=1 FL=1
MKKSPHKVQPRHRKNHFSNLSKAGAILRDIGDFIKASRYVLVQLSMLFFTVEGLLRMLP